MTYLGSTTYWCGPNGSVVDISTQRRNRISAITAGVLFAIGLWIFVDAVVVSHQPVGGHEPHELRALYWLPGLLSTLGLILINSIPYRLVHGNDFDGVYGSGSKFIAVMCFFILFCGLAGGIWVFIAGYLIPNRMAHALLTDGFLTSHKDKLPPIDPPSTPPTHSLHMWPGVAILLQNIFIFASAFVFRFGKIEDDDLFL